MSKNECSIDLYHNEISDYDLYSLRVIFGWRCLGFVLFPESFRDVFIQGNRVPYSLWNDVIHLEIEDLFFPGFQVRCETRPLLKMQ